MAYFDENGKKIDGRKFNKGHKGLAGRKSKAFEDKLEERLKPYDDALWDKITEKALVDGNDRMIELMIKYRYGMPTVKTENKTNMTVSNVELKDLIKFKNDDKPFDENFFDED